MHNPSCDTFMRNRVDVNSAADIIGATINAASALISEMVEHGVLIEATEKRRNRLSILNEYFEPLRR